ncbi:hypothetical protein HYH02_008590 [Chlamydomonas schloesseri]|uniref:Uncharacterized protein n=1 Tax=Chlamydomonas schloesseri TaxID=2026947 RepID=A0A835WFQ7_9CHLO|nr:hypothetical protein HYH02_008590 [Chlamydomonas schloesseri]|eukprot:KAG2446605.1 hypothetical protein HYH02_008590 [Chlamydomonas schloesseri]
MVSRKEAAAAFTAAAKALDVRGKELGALCFALSKLSVEELEVFPIDGDNEAIVEFMRSAKASAASLGVGTAVGAEELPTPKPPQEPPTSTPTQPRAAAGPASDSEAAGGTISALQVTADQIFSCVQQLHGLVLAGQQAASIIEVAASNCKSGPRDQIENLVGQFWSYAIGTHAPCCCAIVPWVPQKEFKWGRHGEDDEQTVKTATKFLRSIAPEGITVLPVQSLEWLDANVHLGRTTVHIKSSKTDYIFVPEAAWAACQQAYGAKLIDGWKLNVSRGTPTDAVVSMISSIVGLYEAKTENMLSDRLRAVRGQALLEYLAINHMRDWPANDVVVFFGDFKRHYAVHAGRKDAGNAAKSLHVAGPAPLPAVAEDTPAAAGASSPDGVMYGFIRALLGTRPASSRGEGTGSGRGGDASDTAGGTSSGSGGTASGSGAGGTSSSGAGGTASGSAGGTASGSRAGIAGGAGRRVADDSGGAGPAAASGGEEGPDGGGRADAAGSEASGSDDADEGLLEAACDNVYAQALWSVLQLPEVYESIGLEEPPAFLQPPTKEEYLASFRAYEG